MHQNVCWREHSYRLFLLLYDINALVSPSLQLVRAAARDPRQMKISTCRLGVSINNRRCLAFLCLLQSDSSSTLEIKETCTTKSKSASVCLIVGNDFPPFESKSSAFPFSHDSVMLSVSRRDLYLITSKFNKAD